MHLLSPDELTRYSQQIKLPNFGQTGQLKLKQAKVFCIGAGGLASTALYYLAAAGVGTLGIIDDDVVALTNLQRQILYNTKQVGVSKVAAAQQKLYALNSEIIVNIYPERFNQLAGTALIPQYDIVIDCCDNYATRYLLNDLSLIYQKPFVFASAAQFIGQCSVFSGPKSPCLRCLYPPATTEQIPNCADTGVLGVVPGLLGILQATETLKWILQAGELLIGRLLIFDALKLQFREYQLAKDPLCRCNQPFALPTNDVPIGINQSAYLNNDLDWFLIDVRSEAEHNKENIGGMLLPLPTLRDNLNNIPRNKPILLYCQSGPRSQLAAEWLLQAAFTNVYFLKGGLGTLNMKEK